MYISRKFKDFCERTLKPPYEELYSVEEAIKALSEATEKQKCDINHEILVLILLHKLIRNIFRHLGSDVKVYNTGGLCVRSYLNLKREPEYILSELYIDIKSRFDNMIGIYLEIPNEYARQNFKSRMALYSPFDFSYKYDGIIFDLTLAIKPNIKTDDLVMHLKHNGLLSVIDIRSGILNPCSENVLYVRDCDDGRLRQITHTRSYNSDVYLDILSTEPLIQDYVCKALNSMSEIYHVHQQLEIIKRNSYGVTTKIKK